MVVSSWAIKHFDFQKLAGKVVNHVGIYGSKMTEGFLSGHMTKHPTECILCYAMCYCQIIKLITSLYLIFSQTCKLPTEFVLSIIQCCFVL